MSSVFDLAKVMGLFGCSEPKTTFTSYLLTKIPRGYLVNDDDVRWYDFCAEFWDGGYSPKSFSEAVRKACEAKEKPIDHCDPFELLVDTGLYQKP